MAPNSRPQLTLPIPANAFSLLDSFDHVELGDGDPVAGMNVLASMCLTLAAVAGPEAGWVSPDGSLQDVGLNWIAAGSLTADLVQSKVLDPLAKLQNVLSDNVELYAEARDSGKTVFTFNGPRNLKEQTIRAMEAETLQRDLLDSGGTLRTIAGKLLVPLGLRDDSSVLHRPGIYFPGIDPRSSGNCLSTAHLRQPFVSFAVDSAQACSRAAGGAQMVMDGFTEKEGLPRRTKGFVLGLFRNVVLEEPQANEQRPFDWLGRLLWLADDDTPSSSPPSSVESKSARIGNVEQRFLIALHHVLQARLKGAHPRQRRKDITSRFVTALRSGGPAHLKLAGPLRTLPVSLAFGISALVDAGEAPKTFQFPLVLPLANHLAHRMVFLSRRTSDLARVAEREMLSHSIMAKLSEGPHTERRLTQRHHRLPIDECREVLALLEAAGKAERVRDEWRAVAPGSHLGAQPVTVDLP